MRTKNIAVLAIIASFCLAVPSQSESKTPSDRPEVSDFEARTLNGKKIRLSNFRGNVVVTSFWATWCVPCKRELEDLKKIHRELGGTFEVIAIATDGPETYSQIRGTVKRHKWPFHVLPDREGEITSVLNPRGTVPYSMYIDQEGRLAYSHEGYSQGDYQKMRARIQKLLKD